MFDFDRFWAEAGCAPGLSKEETDTQLRELAARFGKTGSLPTDIDLAAGLNPRPGVTAQQIEGWERDRGVRLPEVLRQALARQDGGYVFDSFIRILPLAEIANPEGDFWEWASYEEEDVPDRGLVLRLAEDEDLGGSLFLNYNVKGPQQEPGVLEYHSDPGDLNRRAKSVTKFFARMLETFEAPSVDWSETGSLEAVARETIDLSALHGAAAEKEQILDRQAGALVLFTRERTPAGQNLTKTTLPEPLFQAMAMIRPHRPAPVGTHALTLQPQESDGIVELQSQQRRDGRWKNHTSRGVPVCVLFESHERSRLEELRRTLFGKSAASRAQAQEEQQEKLQQQMGALSPQARQAALMQMFLKMREGLAGLSSAAMPNPETMPPEAAALHELLQQKMREIAQRAQETIAKHPVDPETQRLLEEMMKRQRRPDDAADK